MRRARRAATHKRGATTSSGPATTSISSHPPWWASIRVFSTHSIYWVGSGVVAWEANRMSLNVAPEAVGSLTEQVEKVIAVIRPAIQADEGDIALINVDEETGEVLVELMVACVECPASDQTLKAGIERIMKDRVPGVTSVRNTGETLVDDGTAITF